LVPDTVSYSVESPSYRINSKTDIPIAVIPIAQIKHQMLAKIFFSKKSDRLSAQKPDDKNNTNPPNNGTNIHLVMFIIKNAGIDKKNQYRRSLPCTTNLCQFLVLDTILFVFTTFLWVIY